jgi:hypothetical protein
MRNTCVDLQSASAKHQTDAQLLGFAHGKMQNLPNGHGEEEKVCRDLDSGVGDPPRFVLEASGIMYARVPERSDWCALKDGGNDEGHTRCDDPRVHEMTSVAEGLGRDPENAIVETNNSQLVEHQNNFVDDVGAVEPFASGQSGVNWQCRPVSSVAIHDSWFMSVTHRTYQVDTYLDTLSASECQMIPTLQ